MSWRLSLLLCLFAGPSGSCAESSGWPRIIKISGTTKTPVNIIGVQPYSGGAGTLGYKIEPAVWMALEHIEAHPTLLPNHQLVLHYINSSCSKKVAQDEIFEQHVVGAKKFGVLGAACTGACMASSDVSRNFKTTNLAPLCTGAQMSDTVAYPEFVRMAPDLNKNSRIGIDFSSLFGWKRVAVVMENKGLFTSMGVGLANSVRDDPNLELAAFEKIFPKADALEENLNIAGVIDRLIDSEVRIIIFVGYERTMARLSCEALKRGYIGRKVVFIYATFWIGKSWYQDFASLTRCSADEILQASQGLLGIDRLRVADDSVGVHGGSGLLPSELIEEYQSRCDPARNTSDLSRYGCSNMHSAYTYDAVWAFAFTLDRWLSKGHDISEVDYVNADARRTFFETEVNEQDFMGLTGRVRHFSTGDRDGELQMFQIQGSEFKLLATVIDQGKTFSWSGAPIMWGGLQNFSFDLTTLADGQSGEGQWPADKPEVCSSPLHLVSDPNDVLGSERCVPCPGGHSYLWDETLQRGRCMPCDVGTARADDAISPVCETCQVGTFANETGSLKCEFCPEGHTCRAGTADPQPCGLGLYAPAAFNDTECMQCSPGSYADAPASSACQSCDEVIAGSTSPTAARSASECRCALNFVLLAGVGCVACDLETMICPGGVSDQHLVNARAGYYLKGSGVVQEDGLQLQTSKPDSYKCNSLKDCPGGMAPNECPDGHDGLVCAECGDGYTRRAGTCWPCVEQQGRMAFVVIAILMLDIVIVVAILRMSTDPYKVHLTLSTALGTTAGFFVTFVQLHQILGAMAVEWPAALKNTVLAIADIFTFNMEEGSMDCSSLKGGMGAFLPKLVLLPLTLCQLALIWAVGRKLFPNGVCFLTTRGNTLTWDSLFNAMGLVTNIAFVPLAVHTTGIFNCYAHPSGQLSMRSIPFILCYESEWTETMLPAGILSLLALVIAPFAIFVFLVCKATSMPNAAARIPFLMTRFRPDKYWWGLIILGRNLAMALAMIVAPTKPFVIAFLLMSITLAYLYILLKFDPWKFYGHSVIDAVMSIAFALVLTTGIAFADTTTWPNLSKEERDADASWGVLAICGVIPFFASMVSMVICAYMGSRVSMPKEQTNLAEELYISIQQTILASKDTFLKSDRPDTDDIQEMLRRITELSAHDWEGIKRACTILDSLSLNKDLKGRVSRGLSERSSRNSKEVKKSSSIVVGEGVDTEGCVQRLSSRMSRMSQSQTEKVAQAEGSPAQVVLV